MPGPTSTDWQHRAQPHSSPAVAQWLCPDWPAPPHVRALCTTRQAGHSLPPFDSFNLGDHVGDNPVAVVANRAALRRAMPARPVFLSQVHGTDVLELTDQTADGVAADACLTTSTAVACTIMVADCLPLLLTDRQGTWVAAAHAGWRGLAGQAGVGVLEALLQRLLARHSSASARPAPDQVLVWLGPCIGPSAFEVGAEVRQAFTAAQPHAASCFAATGHGKWLADLAALARQRLASLGVSQVFGNDGSADWCTVRNPDRFFSHRRDHVSGRMAACIWLDGAAPLAAREVNP